MLIIGIDPGTATTGWGIIEIQNPRLAGKPAKLKIKNAKVNDRQIKLVDFGCIVTEPTSEMGDRLLILSKALRSLIKTHQPNLMVIEKLFFGANSTSALSVGQARGVVLLVASENKVNVSEYTGLEVKLSVAGHGRADKNTVQTAVRKHLNVRKLPNPKDHQGKEVFRFRDDAYDAVAAAICYVIKSENT